VTLPAVLPYGAIYLAAIVEGEVVFVAAAVMVAAGTLHAWPVVIAGALGAATGDQLYFYALRGRVDGWLGRLQPIAMRRDAMVARIRRHETPMILALRFAPGLRIAIAAACAYARVSPARFSILNTAAAFVWALVLFAVVGRGGPSLLARYGVAPAWGAVIPGVLVLAFGWWLARGNAPPPSNSSA
jgi:membrane protein DedA with SNARE-associated domain